MDEELPERVRNISIAITLALLLGPQIGVPLLLFLVPGRKGSMLTRRELLHERTTVEEVMPVYRDRMAYEGFSVTFSPSQLNARRDPVTTKNTDSVLRQGIVVKADFEQVGSDVAVNIEAKLTDFVIFDTGEGRYIDEMLDRIVQANLDEEASPVVPMRSYQITVALVSAICMVAVAMGGVVIGGDAEVKMAIAMGLVFPLLGVFILSGIGLFNCMSTPNEVTGAPLGIGAIVLGIAAQAFAAAVWLLGI